MPDELPTDAVAKMGDADILSLLTAAATKYTKDWRQWDRDMRVDEVTIFGAVLASRSLVRQEKVLNDMSATIQSQKILLEDMSGTIQNVKKVTENLLRESKILRWLTVVLAALTVIIAALTVVLAFKH